VRVTVVGDDDARLQGYDVVAVVPLLPLLLEGVAAGCHDAQLLDAKRILDDVEQAFLFLADLEPYPSSAGYAL
jgi:hypothetical protein